ncbi:ribonucleoside-diphosphate reductase alpha subunit [Pantoea phage Phynn]|nr:ribonucleoside-diphosphate reductase alpha subunit [Pantoea phage Phynn]
MNVLKSSGVLQLSDASKIEKVLDWAIADRNINKAAFLDAVMDQLRDGMSTAQIQRIAIRYAADRISIKEPQWSEVAANLEMFALRKKVYGQFDPIPFYDHIVKNVEAGRYDKEILIKWSKEDIEGIEKHIDHNKDMEFSFAGVQQLIGKYLVQNRTTDEIFETPQFAFMLIAMCLHQDEPKDTRTKYVTDLYEAVAGRKLSLPTPIMAGVRTPTRQFSSCVVVESGDSLPSINAVSAAVVNYISQRAGIGINGGRIRAMGSPIRNGEATHTGVIPFWKHFQTAVKSCSQGGVRGGAATLYYPIWHLEAEDLFVLKNNRGIESNRIRHLDYGVQINNLMYRRLMQGDYITLFSPDVLGGKLYDMYFENPEEFERLYVELEKDPTVRKKRIKAIDLFSSLMQERAQTGRKYIFNVDEVNQQGSFAVPVRMSNLCLEITLPTAPLSTKDPLEGEIGLCTLMAFVLDNAKEDEFPHLARVAVRTLDNLLDYQNYPVDAALKAKQRRSLGVGITNFASWLASNYCDYSAAYARQVHEMIESFQFNLLVASMELAKERGACGLFHETKYAQGKLPIDWYNKNVDELVSPSYKCDWEWLRKEIAKYGLRNSTLTALMPCESSSQVSNSTNGIEPPRGLVSVKSSKDGSYNQVVPNQNDQLDFYDLLWDMAKRGNEGYLSLVAVMQKFVDQAISTNTNYDPENFETGKVDIQVIIKDLLFAQYYGVKTLYYQNTRDHSGEKEDEVELKPDAADDSDCEGCKI